MRTRLHKLSNTAFMSTPMRPHFARPASQVTSRFFWGGHGGVGGGQADQRLNADITLRFVIDELSRRGCGLCFDAALIPSAYPKEKVSNAIERETLLRSRILRLVVGTQYRFVRSVEDVHWSAIRHFQTDKSWRPPALKKIEAKLMKCDWKQRRDDELVSRL